MFSFVKSLVLHFPFGEITLFSVLLFEVWRMNLCFHVSRRFLHFKLLYSSCQSLSLLYTWTVIFQCFEPQLLSMIFFLLLCGKTLAGKRRKFSVLYFLSTPHLEIFKCHDPLHMTNAYFAWRFRVIDRRLKPLKTSRYSYKQYDTGLERSRKKRWKIDDEFSCQLTFPLGAFSRWL